MDLAGIRKRALVEHGFDLEELAIDELANERYQTLVADAEWNMAIIDFGETVAGLAGYVLPDSVVDLVALTVGTGEYVRRGYRDYLGLKSGRLSVRDVVPVGFVGVFTPNWTPDAQSVISLWPTPDSGNAGLAIAGAAAVAVEPLVDATDVPKVPVDLQPAVAWGVIADGLAIGDERTDAAAYWEARFQGAVQRLASRKKSRVGSGPTRIKVRP